jgi:hypothetical protein
MNLSAVAHRWGWAVSERYEWREGRGLWDSERGTYLLLGDDEHAPILWRALNAQAGAVDEETVMRAASAMADVDKARRASYVEMARAAIAAVKGVGS